MSYTTTNFWSYICSCVFGTYANENIER